MNNWWDKLSINADTQACDMLGWLGCSNRPGFGNEESSPRARCYNQRWKNVALKLIDNFIGFLLVTPLIEVCFLIGIWTLLGKKWISLNVFIGTPLDEKSVLLVLYDKDEVCWMWCTVWNENFWHMFSKKFIVMK